MVFWRARLKHRPKIGNPKRVPLVARVVPEGANRAKPNLFQRGESGYGMLVRVFVSVEVVVMVGIGLFLGRSVFVMFAV